MLHIALFEPEIPPNTGSIARLCAATFTQLHIVGVTGFRMDDRTLKRAGLDSLDQALPESRLLFFTTKATRSYCDWTYIDGDCLVFGPETRGLPKDLLDANSDRCLTIPMPNSRVRSLNLAVSVGIVLYEVLRQFSDRER